MWAYHPHELRRGGEASEGVGQCQGNGKGFASKAGTYTYIHTAAVQFHAPQKNHNKPPSQNKNKHVLISAWLAANGTS